MVIPDKFVVSEVWVGICPSCVECLVIDGVLLAVASFYDGFLTIECMSDEAGSVDAVAFGDLDLIMFWVGLLVPHPSQTWVVLLIFFIGVVV